MKITDKRFLILFSIILIVWAFVYREALLGMEAIWRRSDTFAHGYFILPISIWLLWRDKTKLLVSQCIISWLPLPILTGSLFVWLFAYAADINVLGQFSAIISLICLIWLMIGNKLAWHYKFPLAYLLFMVPMGENLIPQLQDITAWFTVFFLKLNGIPVFNDGLYIQIPTGMFEVAVACSGIRYLIASIAVGSLFAYLTYTSTKKQIVFIVFSIFLPILANGIRAYGIVAIAYYSDMKYATGVDHLIYGWLFFGLVIMLMFWVGGLFADKNINTGTTKNLNKSETKTKDMKYKNVVYIIALVILFANKILFNMIPVVKKPQFPQQALKGIVVTNSPWGITFNNGIKRSHVFLNKKEKNIELFKAVYGNKQDQGELISYNNVLYNHKAWTIISTKVVKIKNNVALIVHLRNSQLISASYIYQFNINKYKTTSENKAKLMQALKSLFRQADYSEIDAVFILGNSNIENTEKKLIDTFSKVFLDT